MARELGWALGGQGLIPGSATELFCEFGQVIAPSVPLCPSHSFVCEGAQQIRPCRWERQANTCPHPAHGLAGNRQPKASRGAAVHMPRGRNQGTERTCTLNTQALSEFGLLQGLAVALGIAVEPKTGILGA